MGAMARDAFLDAILSLMDASGEQFTEFINQIGEMSYCCQEIYDCG
jgi:hypothetical protein